jgi:hypothetical protein
VDAELAEFEAYLRRELPSSLRKELDLRVDELLENAENAIKSELPKLFQELQRQHFQIYKQHRKSETATPTKCDSGSSSTFGVGCEQASALDVPESSFETPYWSPGDTSSTAFDFDKIPFSFDGTLFDMPFNMSLFSDSGYSSSSARNSQTPLCPENNKMELDIMEDEVYDSQLL